jgi:hypothetical protein
MSWSSSSATWNPTPPSDWKGGFRSRAYPRLKQVSDLTQHRRRQ